MPKPYSYSRLSTFEQCPLKFKFRYIDEIIPEIEKTIEAHLGSSVHSALEWLYKNVKKQQIPTIENLIIYYSKSWEREWTENMLIVNSLTPQDYFNKGIQFLTSYYTKHYPFDDNTLEVEKRIILELDEKGEYKIQGFIDRLSYNLQTKEYEIHDYKTANNMPTKEKLEKDRQLALYSLAIKKTFGEDKEVKLIWHFLAHNIKVQLKKTNEELEKLKQEALELIKKIENTTEFSPIKSSLCHWCEYKGICPAWGNKPPKIEKQKTLDEIGKENRELLDIWN